MNPFKEPLNVDGRKFYQIKGDPAFQELFLINFIFALATFEGFFISGSISQKNNNPGNLRPIGASTGFRRFETPELGWERLLHQVKLNIKRGLTLEEFFLGKPGVYAGYAPLGDNPPDVMENYLNFMSKQTGIPRDAILLEYFPFLDDSVITTDIYTIWRPPGYQTTPKQ